MQETHLAMTPCTAPLGQLSHFIKRLTSLGNVISQRENSGIHERQQLVAAAFGNACDVAFLSQLYDAGMAACDSLQVRSVALCMIMCHHNFRQQGSRNQKGTAPYTGNTEYWAQRHISGEC